MSRKISRNETDLYRHIEGLNAGIKILSAFISPQDRLQAMREIQKASENGDDTMHSVALSDMAEDLQAGCPLFGSAFDSRPQNE